MRDVLSITDSMNKVGGLGVDAGLMSASDPSAYAGPAEGESYLIPWKDWGAFCDDIGDLDGPMPVPRKDGGAPAGMVVGGFGGDGVFPCWSKESGGVVTDIVVAFDEEYEEFESDCRDTCPECGGDGIEPGTEDDQCEECGGEGEVDSTFDDSNGGSGFLDFEDKGTFEVTSGYLIVSDPCYVLTPDCSSHPETPDRVSASLGYDRLMYRCRAATGRWTVSVAKTDSGMVGAVRFRRA